MPHKEFAEKYPWINRCSDVRTQERLLYAIARGAIDDLLAQLEGAKKALVCRDCGKQKPYVAICFDCLGEDVDGIAQWHQEVGLSDANGTIDVCNRCHTPWPCDAIKALRLLRDRDEKLKDLAERTRQTVTDWEHWAVDQDNTPPDDLLEWSRLTLEELDRIILEGGS